MEDAMAISEGRLTSTDVASITSIGLMAEGAVGVAVIALAICGLGNIAVDAMLAIATIIFGVALVMQAMESAAEAALGEFGIGGAMVIEALAGLTGIVLGILAFIGGLAPHITPAAMIVFGGALLLSGFVRVTAQRFMSDLWAGAACAQILIGFAAIVLGIIAYLVPGHGEMLTLVALLSLGGSLVIAGATLGMAQTMGGSLTVRRSEISSSSTTFPGE
jgi:hypothetical protein